MADRTDIDALLISALYGELTPADEARLTAHLEMHPADRTALADLTRTRAAVRDSRILSIQLEPPQSVSAMLLREAGRRAPREDAGWFHRFVRSFMAHPAMAAAAMLVLVVGVAGTLYVRHGDLYVGPELSERSEVSAAQTVTADPPPPSGAAAPAAAPARDGELARRDQNAEPAAGSASFGVDLADEKPADPAEGEAYKQAAVARGKSQDLYALEQRKELRGGIAAPEPPATRPAPVATKPSKKGSGGIEMRSRELAPKDLDEDNKVVAKADLGRLGEARDAQRAKNERADRAPGNAGPAGGGATPAPTALALPSQDQPTGQAAYDPSPVESEPSTGAKSKAPAPAPAKTVARTVAKPTPQSQSASPPPPPPAAAPVAESAAEPPRENRAADKIATTDARSEAKAAENKLVAWATQQHRQVVALVSSNKCRDAANAAISIYNRAPDYYAANVATDRSIKPCLAYVTTEREREDRSRAAAKRATSTDTPAASPPAAPIRK